MGFSGGASASPDLRAPAELIASVAQDLLGLGQFEGIPTAHFSGMRYCQHVLPCDPSSFTGWRRRKEGSGDAMHAVLCRAGHNLRLILAHLRVLYFALFGLAISPSHPASAGIICPLPKPPPP